MDEPLYIGNKQSKELHFASHTKRHCHIDKIVDREDFEDFEEAIRAGYQGCGHCCNEFGKGKGRRKYNLRMKFQ